jgi:NAD-dependent deacetylase
MSPGIAVSDRLKSLLTKDTRVVVLTGAGISAESGVPTFRGEEGLWKKFRPEELATFDAFMAQNVDGLHHQAGSRNVVELHGNIRKNKCIQCGKKYESLEGTIEGVPPKCPCGGRIRPDVVWFGEMLPQDAIRHAFEVSERCDLFFSIGTSAVVHPAASLPSIAKRSGAFVVEVNVSPTEISHLVDEALLGKSGDILPSLAKFLK